MHFFQKRSKFLGRTWLALHFITHEIARRVSLSILVAVPIIISIDTALNTQHPASLAPNYPLTEAITNIFDTRSTQMPINLLRIFWGSAIFYFSSIIYNIFKPRILNNMEQWKSSGDYIYLLNKLKINTPGIQKGEISHQLSKYHENHMVKVFDFSSLTLIFIVFLFSLSALLLFLPIIQNLINIYMSCDFLLLIDIRKHSC